MPHWVGTKNHRLRSSLGLTKNVTGIQDSDLLFLLALNPPNFEPPPPSPPPCMLSSYRHHLDLKVGQHGNPKPMQVRVQGLGILHTLADPGSPKRSMIQK